MKIVYTPLIGSLLLVCSLLLPTAAIGVHSPKQEQVKEQKLHQKKKRRSFKEKVAWLFLKKKIKKAKARTEKDTRKTDRFALWSFIAGICSFLLPIAFLAVPTAIVLGFIGLRRINLHPLSKKGKGFAIAGIAIGFTFILAILSLVLIFWPWL